ncbi:putative ribosome quality control (RQC) complex YloA/Tae2 family protein [Methanolinea mesophila]|uniref:ribosome rescue protein RqcH n=1 Tax=Methanolinea mesophila TaxID=547055 RepID=UPI001AE221F7|nr:ribosome rescue protein RqcH [Methanolinea mesophila]MBP1928089.1 putative ribosome quality control (RQC) complex YloA/Tae2 family protein [Methanolinea mesophila]
MATIQGMSGIDIRAVVAELSDLLPLWVDKAYQFEPNFLAIRLNGLEHARYHLLIEPAKRVHLVRSLPPPPKMPPHFAMLLRKYLSGGKLLSVRQHGLQRIVIFEIGKKDLSFFLILELFDPGNVVLCDGDFTIINSFSHHRFRERAVVPGVRYELPGQDPFTSGEEKFSEFLRNDDRDIVRALAVGAMLGGKYAEYVCETAGVDKTAPAGSVDAGPIYSAVSRLLARAETEISPVITRDSCLPFPLTGMGGPGGPRAFNEALESFFPLIQKPEKETKKAEKVSREERIRRQQVAAVKKFEEKIARTERIVALIYENYPLVQEVLESLDQASKSRSWQEIEAILKSQTGGPATRITAVHPEDASVDLDLGEQVNLRVHESLEANVGAYYDTIKKFRKKIEGARGAMAKVPERREKKSSSSPVRKKRWFHRFRWFYTSDGVLVLGGKDAGQNEELVKKYMEGGDRFVHADVHGASVVIVKGRTVRMDEVAQFAASYSGAWRSGHFSADVYSVAPDQVSKTPESGEYVARGSFIVRGERVYYHNVPLEVAIGLETSPELGVIGGPPSAVKERASNVAGLRPGQYEPNDIAKKVLRIIRERLSPQEQKGLKGVLNTETVAAFVPPGGSDLVEP